MKGNRGGRDGDKWDISSSGSYTLEKRKISDAETVSEVVGTKADPRAEQNLLSSLSDLWPK